VPDLAAVAISVQTLGETSEVRFVQTGVQRRHVLHTGPQHADDLTKPCQLPPAWRTFDFVPPDALILPRFRGAERGQQQIGL
jgi:hypothetical protein